jgi:predicted MFS family arabinose efflux permease
VPEPIVNSRLFFRTTITNFFFWGGLNLFVLLPLYIKQQGGAALVTDVAPEARRATVVGVFSAVFLAGNALGAVVFGYLAHGAGYGPMWLSLTLLLLIGFLLSVRLEPGGEPLRNEVPSS